MYGAHLKSAGVSGGGALQISHAIMNTELSAEIGRYFD